LFQRSRRPPRKIRRLAPGSEAVLPRRRRRPLPGNRSTSRRTSCRIVGFRYVLVHGYDDCDTYPNSEL